MIFYVYLLQNQGLARYYVGMSANPEQRLHEHNNGQVRSTKAYRPWNLIYQKGFANRVEARDYEKFLKVKSNKEKLLKNLGIIFE